jgi:hypothetical protein
MSALGVGVDREGEVLLRQVDDRAALDAFLGDADGGANTGGFGTDIKGFAGWGSRAERWGSPAPVG